MASIRVTPEHGLARINPNIYGHFAEHLGACIYEGIWVGEDSSIPNTRGLRNDVIAALRNLAPPVIRWPGGCFADDYHWRDGIGPPEDRPRRINLWWGEDIETNHFGTHEFIELCRQTGAQPYVVGNVGSGTPGEMRNWIEYCNFGGDSTLARERAANGAAEPFDVRYWGVGNENWGCGGDMDPEDYAAAYRRFATYLGGFGGPDPFLIACGPRGNDVDWTLRFFEKLGGDRRSRINAFAPHYYARSRAAGQDSVDAWAAETGSATEYDEGQWYAQLHLGLQMEPLVLQQRAAMDSFDPGRRIGMIVDEWGTWHPPTPGRHPRHLWQQNTMRDAVVAASTLDIFNRHADKVVMANIAQTVNVLQAMVLTAGDRMLVTPTGHVYAMYRAHQGGQSLHTRFESEGLGYKVHGEAQEMPALAGSASLMGNELTLSVVNCSAGDAIEAEISLVAASAREVALTTLEGPGIHAHNRFEAPNLVRPRTQALDVSGSAWTQGFAPASVNVLRILL